MGIIQKIIDKLRGKPVRFYKFDKKVSIDKHTDIDSSTIIGDYTSISDYTVICNTKIGRYCSIAGFVNIGLGEHNTDNISTNGLLRLTEGSYYKELTKEPLEIGNDVWIGVNAIIRRGIKVGNCAVIGANSFVNKDVPDFAVVAGSPAKIIKYRFDEETRQKILESKYWEKEPKIAKQIIKELTEYYNNKKLN